MPKQTEKIEQIHIIHLQNGTHKSIEVAYAVYMYVLPVATQRRKMIQHKTLAKCQNICATMTFRRFVYMFRFRYLLHSPHLMNRLNEFASLCARSQVIHIFERKKN